MRQLNPLGVNTSYCMVDYPVFKANNKYSFINRQGYYDFNVLFDACYGRVGELWLPSWNKDFFLTANIGASDTTINIQDCSYTTYYPATPGTGRYLFFYVNSATWYARKVTSGSNSQLVIESALGMAYTTSQIKYLCILYLVRFDVDELDWSFITPNVTEIEVDFVELPHEYSSIS